jgi:hypothetical protein
VSARQQCARASPDLLRIDDGLARHRLDVELEQQPDAAPLPSELVIRSIRDEWTLKEGRRYLTLDAMLADEQLQGFAYTAARRGTALGCRHECRRAG